MKKKRKVPPKNQPRTVTLRTPEGLNPRQQRFVAEYLIDQNGTQAAIRAGYSARTAHVQAHDLLKHPKIMSAIHSGFRKLLEQPQSEAQKVILEAARLALSDVRKLFDAQGNLRPVAELDDDTAAAVASVEVVEKRGKDPSDVEVTRKVRFWDKNAALGFLGRHHRLLTDQVETTVTVKPKDYEAMSTDELLAERARNAQRIVDEYHARKASR